MSGLIFEFGWVSDGDMEMLGNQHLLYIARSFVAYENESFRAADGPITPFKTGIRRRGDLRHDGCRPCSIVFQCPARRNAKSH